MKKLLSLFLMVVIIGFSLSAQTNRLDKSNAYYVYLKVSQMPITDEEYLNYAKVVEHEKYKKYSNDEFEWAEQFPQIKQGLDKAIANVDLDLTYVLTTNVNFGDYDFTNEGFPVLIKEGAVFLLDAFYYDYIASRDSIFRKRIAIKLIDLDKFNFFKMEKTTARTFLQSRKDTQGNVDRTVTLQITYKIAPYDSQEYKDFTELALDNNYLPVVGIIENIQVYDTAKEKLPKKISDLIQK
ncbi:hypothetical protein HMPREF1221_02103 [Treponema socranskii subsp. paredis ATCC 35535]|nr:hypothetical protein HMPREF1221_02103 [Treponema socranskii subsp. paredis ATCC 35535]